MQGGELTRHMPRIPQLEPGSTASDAAAPISLAGEQKPQLPGTFSPLIKHSEIQANLECNLGCAHVHTSHAGLSPVCVHAHTWPPNLHHMEKEQLAPPSAAPPWVLLYTQPLCSHSRTHRLSAESRAHNGEILGGSAWTPAEHENAS